MTLHSEDKTEPVPRRTINGHATAVPTAQLLLDSVCRSASELARTAHKPPQRIKLQYGQTSVEVEWPAPESAERPPAPAPQPVERLPPAAPVPTAPAPAPERPHETPHYVCSPTVGTFYHSPEPGAPAYVRVGDVVRAGQPIGVLEVMKMMSTIEADAGGRVVEIVAPDAQSVEYQQRLIAIEPQETEQ